MKKICVLVVVCMVFSGFSWGGREDSTSDDTAVTSVTSMPKASGNSALPARLPTSSTPTSAKPVDSTQQFPTAVFRALSDGDQKEREDRAQALRRLSVALAELSRNRAATVGEF